jgi:hypothetical protein
VSFIALSLPQVLAVLGAVALPVTALYLLKMHRQRVEVPFVKLWDQVLKERQPARWWRRLKRVLSLLLQLAVAALVAAALGDPRPAAAGRGARSLAIVVDCSASMQARDVRPTRMARARTQALALVHSLSPRDAALIVRMDAEPTPVSGWETDAGALERAIGGLEASDTAADWDSGLRLAEDALRGRPQPMIVVISDGALPEPSRTPASQVRFLPVGVSGENVGVTAFNVRRYPVSKGNYEVLLEVESFSDHPATRTLTVEADGEVVDATTLTLAPHERSRRFYPNLSGSARRLTARLTPGDALPVDDQAYALLPPRRATRVLAVSPGNLFLEGALLLDDDITLDRVAPADYSAERTRGYDIIVFDRFAPAEPPRARGLLYIEPPAERSPFPVRERVRRPILSERAQGHPLLRWVTLSDVNISESEVFALAPSDVAIAGGLHQPVIAAGVRGGQRVVAIGFDLRRSDLPMRVAFPVLLHGALEWFGDDDTQPVATYRTGHPARLTVPGGAGEVALTGPGGENRPLSLGRDGQATLVLARAGFYQLRRGDAEILLAANLADAAESAIRPQKLTIAGREVPAPELQGAGLRSRFWVYLALAALALSFAEWLTYHRRWTV